MNKAKNQINNLEHKKAKNNAKQEVKIIPKSEDGGNSRWDNFKHYNTYIIGVP